MLFTTSNIASLMALSSIANAAAFFRRESVSGVTLYAYGIDSGLPLIYADGLAYIGLNGPSNASVSTNVTFTIDSSDSTIPWTITANSSTASFNETLSMYIIPTNGSFSQVGYSTDATLPEGAVNVGFTLFGKSVAYAASDSDLELTFWAANSTTDGVYALYWDSAAASSAIPDGALPVTVKTTVPSIPSV
ncbi:hypothetical protein BKA61DRAFT_729623 [Leptodontidium sp. MPI-SDFR-AT-0119]|nr:hypothetical protein BKA61DRAFT_729623 [Leptodontidium sp. MPI-SDFR-AT-0119]